MPKKNIPTQPTSKIHVFTQRCVDFEELLAKPDLKTMLNIAFKQSKSINAKIMVDFPNYKDYDIDESCPKYFGMFVEWLGWHFLNHYGHEYNIHQIEMTDSFGSTTKDLGVDGNAMSVKKQLLRKTYREAKPGSPVYIQVKGTRNKNKEYCANDGSRLNNFLTNATTTAMKAGHAYQARYILFTTGKGIHHTLKEMQNDFIEVISFDRIDKSINNDIVFLNILRKSVGLSEFPLSLSDIDQESAYIRDQLINEE